MRQTTKMVIDEACDIIKSQTNSKNPELSSIIEQARLIISYTKSDIEFNGNKS